MSPRAWCALVALALTRCTSGNPSPAPDGFTSGDALFAADALTPSDVPAAADAPAASDVLTPSDVPDASAATLAARHPCDRGIADDPAVLWAEDFEEGSVAAVTARYENANHPARISLVPDVPPGGCGGVSARFVAGVSANATDLYHRLPDQDEVFIRWYAKYQPGIHWHHSGVWFGGYNPATPYPNPQAGLRPNGDDRFAISVEPAFDIGAARARLDTYDYWMGMRSWMDMPSGSTAYYGNSVVHQRAFTLDEGQWICLEVHVRLNTDLASSRGAVLDIWKNDAAVAHFDDAAPAGCWIRDKFCTSAADGPECTDYPSLCVPPRAPLDMRWRSTAALRVNYFWPQNYITEGPDGALQFDHMVVATQRVGCLR